MLAFALLVVCSPAIFALYAYMLYPLILRLLPPRLTPSVPVDGQRPMVTVVIPAYNERTQIRGAIDAVLAQDYSKDRLQLLVVSDASTDGTDEIVAAYGSAGVELLRMPVRGGKTAAENASFPHIRGDIVVNTDASVRLHPQAVSALVRAMADRAVGVASSRDVSVIATVSANESEAGYVGFEMWLRSLETRSGGIVGASGSGYAIRRSLHELPVRHDLSRDFSAALTAHRNGFIAISVDEAICYVPRTASPRDEYRRKVRTISRGMETLHFNGDLLDVSVHGVFAYKLLSHKVARWLVPISAVPSALVLAYLSREHWWAAVLLSGAAIGGVLALIGARWPHDRAMPAWLPTQVLGALAANLAVVHSAWRFIWGHEDHLWEPTRRAAVESAPGDAALARP
jgi:glycosyltransferase involved in cell wall biosynthesis